VRVPKSQWPTKENVEKKRQIRRKVVKSQCDLEAGGERKKARRETSPLFKKGEETRERGKGRVGSVKQPSVGGV